MYAFSNNSHFCIMAVGSILSRASCTSSVLVLVTGALAHTQFWPLAIVLGYRLCIAMLCIVSF